MFVFETPNVIEKSPKVLLLLPNVVELYPIEALNYPLTCDVKLLNGDLTTANIGSFVEPGEYVMLESSSSFTRT